MTTTSHDRDDILDDDDWPTLTHTHRPSSKRTAPLSRPWRSKNSRCCAHPGCSEITSPTFTPWPAWWPSCGTGSPCP